MQEFKIVSKKETKQLISKLEQQYNIKNLNLEYILLKIKEKIYIISKDFSKIDLTNLNINSIGLYFADITNKIRLTIEGSQIIGPLANNNLLEINEEQLKEYFKGNNLKTTKSFKDFVILKYQNKFLGTGKYKDNQIINFFPKERRINYNKI